MPIESTLQTAVSSNEAYFEVDSHHHLWRYNSKEFDWLTTPLSELRRDFLPADLAAALDSSHVDVAIAVQARQSLEETDWLLQCAGSTPRIAGVVGWAPLDAPELPTLLDSYTDLPKLVGFREIAQGQPDGFFDRPNFNIGIAELTSRNIAYDVLIYEHQLPQAIAFIDRHPDQRFVLDHAAKPRIRVRELEPWTSHIRDLARRPNIMCKLSGLVTEADWTNWDLASLRPYMDVCVEAFGPDRLLAGSDWPVCLVASSHARWWNLLHDYFASFTRAEQKRIFAENAIDVYRLSL